MLVLVVVRLSAHVVLKRDLEMRTIGRRPFQAYAIDIDNPLPPNGSCSRSKNDEESNPNTFGHSVTGPWRV